jgi:hypothetical protein
MSSRHRAMFLSTCLLLGLSLPVAAQISKGIAIVTRADSQDEAEQLIYALFGQDEGVQYIHVPPNANAFFEVLRSYRARGIRIHTLLIGGHGDPDNPGIPRINLRDDTINNVDIDLATMKAAVKRSESSLASGRANPALTRSLEERKQRIAYLESLSEAMGVDAKILLISCGPASSPAGKQFVKNLGELLLGRRGGWIYASERDVAIGSVASHGNQMRVFYETGTWPDMYDIAVIGTNPLIGAKWWRHRVEPRAEDRQAALASLDGTSWDVTVTGPAGQDQYRWVFSRTRDNVTTSWRIRHTLLATSNPQRQQFVGQTSEDSYIEQRVGAWEYNRQRGNYSFNQAATCTFTGSSFTCDGVQNDFMRTGRISIKGTGSTNRPSEPVLGSPPPASAPVDFGGEWTADAGQGWSAGMSLRQSGNRVSGTYNSGGVSGTLNGTIDGGILLFNWGQNNGRKGAGHFILAPDGRSMKGFWSYSANPWDRSGGAWNAVRK